DHRPLWFHATAGHPPASGRGTAARVRRSAQRRDLLRGPRTRPPPPAWAGDAALAGSDFCGDASKRLACDRLFPAADPTSRRDRSTSLYLRISTCSLALTQVLVGEPTAASFRVGSLAIQLRLNLTRFIQVVACDLLDESDDASPQPRIL